MVKELMHDPIFLAGKADTAAKEDVQTAQDLLDTLIEHKEDCVGMAANMIGVKKRIIAFLDDSGKAPCYSRKEPNSCRFQGRFSPLSALFFLVICTYNCEKMP